MPATWQAVFYKDLEVAACMTEAREPFSCSHMLSAMHTLRFHPATETPDTDPQAIL